MIFNDVFFTTSHLKIDYACHHGTISRIVHRERNNMSVTLEDDNAGESCIKAKKQDNIVILSDMTYKKKINPNAQYSCNYRGHAPAAKKTQSLKFSNKTSNERHQRLLHYPRGFALAIIVFIFGSFSFGGELKWRLMVNEDNIYIAMSPRSGPLGIIIPTTNISRSFFTIEENIFTVHSIDNENTISIKIYREQTSNEIINMEAQTYMTSFPKKDIIFYEEYEYGVIFGRRHDNFHWIYDYLCVKGKKITLALESSSALSSNELRSKLMVIRDAILTANLFDHNIVKEE